MPEVSFLNKPLKEQVKIAVDYGDPKLLQIVLGPRYLQLWHHWQGHAIISCNMLTMHQATQCQLPLQIIDEQMKILNKQALLLKVQSLNLKLKKLEKAAQREKLEGMQPKYLSRQLSLNQQKLSLDNRIEELTEMTLRNRELEHKERQGHSLGVRIEILRGKILKGENEKILKKQVLELERQEQLLNEQVALLREEQQRRLPQLEEQIQRLEDQKPLLDQHIKQFEEGCGEPPIQRRVLEDRQLLEREEALKKQLRALLENDLVPNEGPKQTVELIKELFKAIHRGAKEYKKKIKQRNTHEYQLFCEPLTEEEERRIEEAARNNADDRIEERNSGNPYGYRNKEGESLCPSIDEAIKINLISECDSLIEGIGKIIESKEWKEANTSTSILYYIDKINNALTGEKAKQVEDLAQDIPNNMHPYLSRAKDIALVIPRIFRPIVGGVLSCSESMLDSMNNLDNVKNRQTEVENIIKALEEIGEQKTTLSNSLGDARSKVEEDAINKMKDDKTIGRKKCTALIDKPFVEEMYRQLLDHYLASEAIKDEKNPLHGYIRKNEQESDIDKVKNRILIQKLGAKEVVKEMSRPESLNGKAVTDGQRAMIQEFMREKRSNTEIHDFLKDNKIITKNSEIDKDLKHYKKIDCSTINQVLADISQNKNSSENHEVISVLMANVVNWTSICNLIAKDGNEKVQKLKDKSINTIMMDVHNMLFDFEDKSDDKILNLVSVFPSEDGEFKRTSHDKMALTKTGDAKNQDIIKKIQAFIKDMEQKKEDGKLNCGRGFSWGLYYLIYGRPTNYEVINEKLLECFDRAMCALIFKDEQIMHDYIKEVKEKKKSEKNSDVTALYDLISGNTSWFKTAPKWTERKKQYTLGSFLGLVSKEAIELDEQAAEEEKKQTKEEITKTKEEITKVNTRADTSDLRDNVRRNFVRQLRKLDNKLQDIVIESQDIIVNGVVCCIQEHNLSHDSIEQVMNTVIEEIKFNKDQVTREGLVNAELVDVGISHFLNPSSNLKQASVRQKVDKFETLFRSR